MVLDNNDIILITQIIKNAVPPWYASILTLAIGAIAAGSFTVLGIKLNQDFAARMEEHKCKLGELQQKKHIYSSLRGILYLVTNTYYAHGYSYINFQYYQTLFELKSLKSELSEAECVKKIPEHTKAEKEGDRVNEYALDFGKANKELMEIIGLIQVSFDGTEEMGGRIAKIEDALGKHIKITSEYQKTNGDDVDKEVEELKKWQQKKANEEIPNYIENELAPSIENLLVYLKAEIDNDANVLNEVEGPRCYRVCKFFCNP
jgi:hypothetical protein